MVDISTDHDLHVVAVLVGVSELAHHLAGDHGLDVVLLAQDGQAERVLSVRGVVHVVHDELLDVGFDMVELCQDGLSFIVY